MVQAVSIPKSTNLVQLHPALPKTRQVDPITPIHENFIHRLDDCLMSTGHLNSHNVVLERFHIARANILNFVLVVLAVITFSFIFYWVVNNRIFLKLREITRIQKNLHWFLIQQFQMLQFINNFLIFGSIFWLENVEQLVVLLPLRAVALLHFLITLPSSLTRPLIWLHWLWIKEVYLFWLGFENNRKSICIVQHWHIAYREVLDARYLELALIKSEFLFERHRITQCETLVHHWMVGLALTITLHDFEIHYVNFNLFRHIAPNQRKGRHRLIEYQLFNPAAVKYQLFWLLLRSHHVLNQAALLFNIRVAATASSEFLYYFRLFGRLFLVLFVFHYKFLVSLVITLHSFLLLLFNLFE